MKGQLSRTERFIADLALDKEVLQINSAALRESYYAVIEEIDITNHQSLILQIRDQACDEKILKRFNGCNITLSGQLKNVKMTFEAQVLQTQWLHQNCKIHIKFPDKINYQDRRQAYRVLLSSREKHGVTLILNKVNSLKGKIVDISVTGLCIGFTEDLSNYLKIGDVIYPCVIELEKKQKMKCTLVVRRVFGMTPEIKNQLGVEFIKLDQTKEQLIGRFVMALQRREIKKDKRIR